MPEFGDYPPMDLHDEPDYARRSLTSQPPPIQRASAHRQRANSAASPPPGSAAPGHGPHPAGQPGRPGAAAAADRAAKLGPAQHRRAPLAAATCRRRTGRCLPGWKASCTSTARSPGPPCAKACAAMPTKHHAVAQVCRSARRRGLTTGTKLRSILDRMLIERSRRSEMSRSGRPRATDPAALERLRELLAQSAGRKQRARKPRMNTGT